MNLRFQRTQEGFMHTAPVKMIGVKVEMTPLGHA